MIHLNVNAESVPDIVFQVRSKSLFCSDCSGGSKKPMEQVNVTVHLAINIIGTDCSFNKGIIFSPPPLFKPIQNELLNMSYVSVHPGYTTYFTDLCV